MRPALAHIRMVRVLTVATTTLVAASLMPVARMQSPEGQTSPAPGGRGTLPTGPVVGNRGGAGANDPANTGADFEPKAAVVALSPEEEARRFILPPGYHLELVLAEPQVVSPAAVAFDGNGRMYVAEMRTFMRDADATGQTDPVSRISMHESTKGDGKFDRHTVFVDHLVLPRMVLPLATGILVNETHSDDLVLFTDTNGDGIADRRELFYSGVGSGRDGNVQHEQSGLVWGLDNWIYTTYNSFRFRWTPHGILREPTAPSGAEWGLAMDDDGKMWFVNSGGERGPVNFQVPIQYGAYSVSDQFEPGFDIVWPAPGIGDMQGGLPRVRMPVNNLNHFTATNGPEIVRSDRYPQDMQGDLLFCDPVGRLIRRAKVVKNEGLTQLRNVYPGSEFIVSTDPLFRPINIKLGPDGALYVVEMYQGIIQDGNWTGRGSYLRAKIEQYGLDKVTNHGRIWRLRFDGIPATAPASVPARSAVPAIELGKTWPHMNDETAEQLVSHLGDPNGWWRDTAQRLLVLKQDKSVVSALQQMTRSGSTVLGRMHAMWTLEGLGALDASLVRSAMQDQDPRMRVQAIRASETLYKAGNRTFEADYRTMAKDAEPDVVIQALLTLNVLKIPDVADVVKSAQAATKARGVKEIGDLIVRPPATGRGGGRGGAALAPEQQQLIDQGGRIFNELCFSCHGEDGRGRPQAGSANGMLAPPLAGSPRVNGHRDYIIKTLLKGMTGPLGDNSYSEVMVPMGTNNDDWIASVASYVRTSFGNSAGFVTPADVARVRAATANRKAPWTLAELEPTLPRRLDPDPATWKVTASQNSATAASALSMNTWTSGAPQAPGMWFQIELPQPVMLAEIEFDSPAGARGGGGRGGAPTAAMFPYPRGYRVEVSLDGAKWGTKPVAEGKGSGAHTTITFAPVRAKFLRISETETAEPAASWAMSNVRLYEAGSK